MLHVHISIVSFISDVHDHKGQLSFAVVWHIERHAEVAAKRADAHIRHPKLRLGYKKHIWPQGDVHHQVYHLRGQTEVRLATEEEIMGKLWALTMRMRKAFGYFVSSVMPMFGFPQSGLQR